MRSKQRRTFKFREEVISPAGSPATLHGPSHSRSRQGQFKASQGQVSEGLSQKQHLQRLLKENKELKKQIIQLKVSQFYNLDDAKLKQLIQEVEALRKQIKGYQRHIQELQMHNDFLSRTNVHLKRELQKEIQQRTKSLRKQDVRLTHTKQTDHTLNTDCSRNQEEEVSHLTHSSSNVHFLQNITLEDSKDILKGMDYQSGNAQRSVEKSERHPRKSLMQKILSPRRGKEKSPGGENNEYLLYRRQKDKKTTCS